MILWSLKYLVDDTDGIQCLAISAPLPFKTNTDLLDQIHRELK